MHEKKLFNSAQIVLFKSLRNCKRQENVVWAATLSSHTTLSFFE